MYRASTPTYRMEVPWGKAEISDLWMTFSQNDVIVLEKTYKGGHFAIDGNDWSVTLTQEEANLFKADAAEAQVRILFADGTSLPTQVFRLSVRPVLNDEVMA